MESYLMAAAGASVLSLAFVWYLAQYVLSKPEGSDKMAEISRQVQIGARAFLRREYRYVFTFVVVVALIIAIAGGMDAESTMNWRTSVAFAIGAIASSLAGFLGMNIATRANARTAHAAESGGVNSALDVAISGGAVMGMGVVGIALLGLVFVYYLFAGDPQIVNGYAMGASLVALFARSGGGIFTKGADMGADLVGKVEAGIPEDDPRNPAVIADNVGDNVGDVAGLGADLLESYVASIIATVAIVFALTSLSEDAAAYARSLPFVISAVGILSSAAGVIYVKRFAASNPQSALMNGVYISSGLTIAGTWAYAMTQGTSFVISEVEYAKWGPALAATLGTISGRPSGS